uniref:Uncharacterized protein n=1 Tax=Rhizophora mucronata TaxID=61149 RepID=A0A2P2PSJ2_RHIMU
MSRSVHPLLFYSFMIFVLYC